MEILLSGVMRSFFLSFFISFSVDDKLTLILFLYPLLGTGIHVSR